MIRLLLMRHANALDGSVDRERSLSQAGLQRANRVAMRLREMGWLPNEVIVSDATRCLQTLKQMRPLFDSSVQVRIEATLYLSTPEVIGEIIRSGCGEPPLVSGCTLMVLAHNPGISMAASNWTGNYHSLSPGSLVRLTIDAPSFSDASPTDVIESHHLDSRRL